MASEHHIPHALRLSAFLLRVAIGLNFFYLGFTALFDQGLGAQLRGRSLDGLYAWLVSPSSSAPAIGSFGGVSSWIHAIAAWAFLVIGICITIGLFTRLASVIGVILILTNYLPTISFSSFNPAQFINDELIVLFALFVLIFAKAGTYFGLDKFLKFSTKNKG